MNPSVRKTKNALMLCSQSTTIERAPAAWLARNGNVLLVHRTSTCLTPRPIQQTQIQDHLKGKMIRWSIPQMRHFDSIDEQFPVPNSPPVISARSGRPIRLPARYDDYIPDELIGLRHAPPPPASASTTAPVPSILNSVTTEPDSMGLFRVYATQPTHDPNAYQSAISSIVDAPTLEQNPLFSNHMSCGLVLFFHLRYRHTTFMVPSVVQQRDL
ncbi:hypothetical protein JVU11DRAFT_9328 [Chiua virens]|nr:hypothetical protein JVU11DRAFT_9328 [Chiua virens]